MKVCNKDSWWSLPVIYNDFLLPQCVKNRAYTQPGGCTKCQGLMAIVAIVANFCKCHTLQGNQLRLYRAISKFHAHIFKIVKSPINFNEIMLEIPISMHKESCPIFKNPNPLLPCLLLPSQLIACRANQNHPTLLKRLPYVPAKCILWCSYMVVRVNLDPYRSPGPREAEISPVCIPDGAASCLLR
jgi:hypothetical protein